MACRPNRTPSAGPRSPPRTPLTSPGPGAAAAAAAAAGATTAAATVATTAALGILARSHRAHRWSRRGVGDSLSAWGVLGVQGTLAVAGAAAGAGRGSCSSSCVSAPPAAPRKAFDRVPGARDPASPAPDLCLRPESRARLTGPLGHAPSRPGPTSSPQEG